MVSTLPKTDDNEFRCFEDGDVYRMVPSAYRAVSETAPGRTQPDRLFRHSDGSTTSRRVLIILTFRQSWGCKWS